MWVLTCVFCFSLFTISGPLECRRNILSPCHPPCSAPCTWVDITATTTLGYMLYHHACHCEMFKRSREQGLIHIYYHATTLVDSHALAHWYRSTASRAQRIHWPWGGAREQRAGQRSLPCQHAPPAHSECRTSLSPHACPPPLTSSLDRPFGSGRSPPRPPIHI